MELPKLILASPLADIIKPGINSFISGINLRSNPLFDKKGKTLGMQTSAKLVKPKIGEITDHIEQAASLIKRFADNLKPKTDKEAAPEYKDDEKAS
jgi:hypothetical protein